MIPRHTRSTLTYLALGLGALGLLATGAVHFEEYAGNMFSTVPTIGTLFLVNFIAATVLGIVLVLPLGRWGPRLAQRFRWLSATGGIALAASSLAGLWISETSSLFGFSDHGFRPAIAAAVVSESVTILALGTYLALTTRTTRAPQELLG